VQFDWFFDDLLDRRGFLCLGSPDIFGTLWAARRLLLRLLFDFFDTPSMNLGNKKAPIFSDEDFSVISFVDGVLLPSPHQAPFAYWYFLPMSHTPSHMLRVVIKTNKPCSIFYQLLSW